MNKSVLKDMHEHARACYPEEACGLIVKIGKRVVAVPCKNIAEEDRDMRFVIDPKDYSAAADMGEVAAIWHSHVNIPATPSGADLTGCELSELPWHIFSIYKNESGFECTHPITIEPSGYEAPYLGRPYVFGVHDCYALVRDFYKREFGVELRNYHRQEFWWRKGFNYFVDNYPAENFIRLEPETEPKRGDLFLIQSDESVPNHIAVYVGNGIMYHHMHGRLSSDAIYGGYWKSHTTHHLRHKSQC